MQQYAQAADSVREVGYNENDLNQRRANND